MARLRDMLAERDAETFFGLPKLDDFRRLTQKIVVIGAPCATPYRSVGAYCSEGPAAIRRAGSALAGRHESVNFDLGGPVFPENVSATDLGDLPQDPNDPAGNRSRIFGAVNQVLDAGACPVVLGGDDSVPIPMLEAYGARERPITILQIDAHIDWRNHVEGERMGLSSTMRRASEMSHVNGIIQVGQRGAGTARPEDLNAALGWGTVFVPGGEVARTGVGRALDAIPKGGDVVVSLDLDALDPSVMPAVFARTAGGLSYWQVLELFAGVAEKGRIVGVAMVELMPERDVDGMGAEMAAQLLASVLGLLDRQS
ncbi:MAG: arginase family protein [Pseudomonadota bacterium]